MSGLNRSEVIRMARQAGSMIEAVQEKDLQWLERFASLVAAAEREKIIAMAESSEFNRMRGEFSPTSTDLARAIKDRK